MKFRCWLVGMVTTRTVNTIFDRELFRDRSLVFVELPLASCRSFWINNEDVMRTFRRICVCIPALLVVVYLVPPRSTLLDLSILKVNWVDKTMLMAFFTGANSKKMIEYTNGAQISQLTTIIQSIFPAYFH